MVRTGREAPNPPGRSALRLQDPGFITSTQSDAKPGSLHAQADQDGAGQPQAHAGAEGRRRTRSGRRPPLAHVLGREAPSRLPARTRLPDGGGIGRTVDDHGADPVPEASGTWCSMSEAARRLGISERAVRNRMRRGTLDWRPRGNRGREVLIPSGSDTAPSTDTDAEQEDTVDLLVLTGRLQERLKASEVLQDLFRKRAEAAEGEVTRLRAELAEAR